MGIVIKKSGDGFELHPEGVFVAKVEEVSEFDDHPEWGQRIKIVYTTKESDDGIWDICTLKLSSKSKLGGRLQAILNCKWDEIDSEVDLASIEGLYCNIFVQHNEVGDRTYANVMNVMPASEDNIPF